MNSEPEFLLSSSMHRLVIRAAICCLVGFATTATGQQSTAVYQCTDTNGAVAFQDQPCESSSDERLRQIQVKDATRAVPVTGADFPDGKPVLPPQGLPAGPRLKQDCGSIEIESFSQLGISLEHTTAPALDGFWGEAVRGLARRPDISLETFNQDVNDTAMCADIQFKLRTFGGSINNQNNLGRQLRRRFVALSSNGVIGAARSGYFSEGRIKLGASYAGTYCFWRASEAGPIVELGCR